MARRATAVKELRNHDPDLFLVDFGNVTEPGRDLPELRGRTILKAMALMGYDAMALGGFDRKVLCGDQGPLAEVSFPVLTGEDTCAGLPNRSHVILTRGGVSLALFSVDCSAPGGGACEADMDRVRRAYLEVGGGTVKVLIARPGSVDLDDLLSGLPAFDLVLAPGISGTEEQTCAQVAGATVASCRVQGQALGEVVLEVEGGAVKGHRCGEVLLEEDTPDDEAMAALVAEFLQQKSKRDAEMRAERQGRELEKRFSQMQQMDPEELKKYTSEKGLIDFGKLDAVMREKRATQLFGELALPAPASAVILPSVVSIAMGSKALSQTLVGYLALSAEPAASVMETLGKAAGAFGEAPEGTETGARYPGRIVGRKVILTARGEVEVTVTDIADLARVSGEKQGRGEKISETEAKMIGQQSAVVYRFLEFSLKL